MTTIRIDTVEAWDRFFRPGDPATSHDTAQVKRYMEAFAEGREPPPIVIFELPDGTRYLGDGRHRLVAYRELGLSEIPADIYPATNAGDALRQAMEALGPAGRCRSECARFLREEKRESVTFVLLSEIDCDRRYWFAVIKALGADPAKAKPGDNGALIDQYAAAMRAGSVFPPITLVRAADGRLFLYDGRHRLQAAKTVGLATIRAIVWPEESFLSQLPTLARALTQVQREVLLFGNIA